MTTNVRNADVKNTGDKSAPSWTILLSPAFYAQSTAGLKDTAGHQNNWLALFWLDLHRDYLGREDRHFSFSERQCPAIGCLICSCSIEGK